MRCSLPPHGDCPTVERCEIEGCRRFLEPNVPAKPREPVDLNYQPGDKHSFAPGRIVRGLMRLTEAGQRAVKHGPTPFAPRLEVDPEAVLAALEHPMNETPTPAPAAPPPPPKPAPGRSVLEIRARRIGSGWLLYANGQEVDVATDGSIPGLVAELARQ